ncbi:ABC transporter substrate-binding protein [Nocardioides insulae]|uniref:ABC transporter substrate-binding protein n=1 Tax=Nocardioides insulae TaxID=394734 RepID=UPI0009FFD40F|nr:ABC transporter substrate-binding protein [Nocardioides insulae]
MRVSTGTRLRTAGVLLACSALTTACFSGSGSDEGSASASGDEPGAVVTDAGDPVDGGVLYTAATTDAISLDPQAEASFTVHYAVGTVYNRLLAFQTGEQYEFNTNELKGDLAEEWEANDDRTEWTFHLREGVKWQNKPPVNGREFTSKDVTCTLDRITSLPGHQIGLIGNVAKVETPDDYTVVFKLKSPQAAFDETMANPFMVILPCEGTEGKFDLAEEAIGTGPFMLESWKKDQERVYVKNPDYFLEGLPHLDGINVTVMPDAQAQIAALRSGKLDIISALSTEKNQVDQLVKQIDGLQLVQEEGTSHTRIPLNVTKPPFDDVRVRQAVGMAIDREGMANTIRVGGVMTAAVTPSIFGGLTEEESLEAMPYDPEAAKKLLADAGYPDGFDTTLTVTNGYGETVVREAQWVQEDLAEIGINAEIKIDDYATYIGDTWPTLKYDMIYGLQTPMLTADEYLTTEYTSDGTRNWYGIKDPKLDKMIAEQRTIIDDTEREQAIRDIQYYILENVASPVTLYAYNTQTILAPDVRNFWNHPDYSQLEMEDVWLDPDAG